MSKLDFLDPFIIQSGFDEKKFGPGGQVIRNYPKEYMDLKMRVSFGKGGPARGGMGRLPGHASAGAYTKSYQEN